MSFMKKGLREDSRKQKDIIKKQIYMKLNKIGLLGSIAYNLSILSKDITINNLESALKKYKIKEDLDDLDKKLIIGEYNRIINESKDKH